MAIVEVEVSSDATRKQRGFVALALAGDNAARASEACGIPQTTLKEWRQDHRHEYDRVRRELVPQLEQLVVNESYARVIELGELEARVAAALFKAIEAGEIPKRDLPGALRNITTSKAINVDKILALSGRPTSIVEHRSAQDLVRRLASLGAVVDGSAVELEPGHSSNPG